MHRISLSNCNHALKTTILVLFSNSQLQGKSYCVSTDSYDFITVEKILKDYFIEKEFTGRVYNSKYNYQCQNIHLRYSWMLFFK